jgi:undecaprenyl diphosphate synthase
VFSEVKSMFFAKKPVINRLPRHVAIILDGNGRWAQKRGMPRTFGHRMGIQNIRTITLAAQELGIQALSVFAFSTENWNRPKDEVDFLMTMPSEFDRQFHDDFMKHDIKVIFSGRRTRLSEENLRIMDRMTEESRSRKGLVLNICFDYGSYDELTGVVRSIAEEVRLGNLLPENISSELISARLMTKDLPPLDLLIRTSGEQRLSNFLLWQAAYTELYFTPVHWPAFTKSDLIQALAAYSRRDRRFGAVKG